MGPNAIHPEILKLGDNMDVNFNAPARKEGFTCAEFRSKDNQNYVFLSLPDNDALDFQATPVTTSFWVKTRIKQLLIWGYSSMEPVLMQVQTERISRLGLDSKNPVRL